jgi:hypothetical protein
MMDPELGDAVIAGLIARPRRVLRPQASTIARSWAGDGDLIDPTVAPPGGSDARKDGIAVGYRRSANWNVERRSRN